MKHNTRPIFFTLSVVLLLLGLLHHPVWLTINLFYTAIVLAADDLYIDKKEIGFLPKFLFVQGIVFIFLNGVRYSGAVM